MRKLRDDILITEAEDWVDSHCIRVASLRGSAFIDLARNIREQTPEAGKWDYPDSFYEQPPVGSFGRFWGTTCGGEYSTYGYLEDIREECPKYKLRCANGGVIRWWNFEPGLPQDVDKDGMPI
jgi:hypothetical protein